MERTLVLIKPDGVKRGLIGESITRFEKVGLKIVAMKMIWVDRDFAAKHYPISRQEWLKTIGDRALETYKEYGYDPEEDLTSTDPLEMGKMMAGWLVDALTFGPVVAMLIEGMGAVKTVRKIVGHTFPDKAAPGTIRGDFASDWGLTFKSGRAARNIVHASGNPEEAQYEEKLWFKPEEIFDYI